VIIQNNFRIHKLGDYITNSNNVLQWLTLTKVSKVKVQHLL